VTVLTDAPTADTPTTQAPHSVVVPRGDAVEVDDQSRAAAAHDVGGRVQHVACRGTVEVAGQPQPGGAGRRGVEQEGEHGDEPRRWVRRTRSRRMTVR